MEIDVLAKQNTSEIGVGAQSHRIPLILILDTPHDVSKELENALSQFLDRLYGIAFEDFTDNEKYKQEPARISLTIASNVGNGCILLPPRLLKERPLAERGFGYFNNRSWIEFDSLKKLLFPLPYGNQTGMSEVHETIQRMFRQRDKVPPAYAMNNGDSRGIILIMSATRHVEDGIEMCRKLRLEIPHSDDFFDSFCFWNVTDNSFAHKSLPNEPVHAFGSGLDDWLIGKLKELSRQISQAFEAQDRHAQSINIFPDALLPSHRGVCPRAILTSADNPAYCSAAMLEIGDANDRHLKTTVQLELPLQEDLREEDVNISFDPDNLFSRFVFSLKYIGINKDDKKVFQLVIRCNPLDWKALHTGLNIKGIISLKEGNTPLVFLYGSVWMPPQTLPEEPPPPPPVGKSSKTKTINFSKLSSLKINFNFWMVVCVVLLLSHIATAFMLLRNKPNDNDIARPTQPIGSENQRIIELEEEIVSLKKQLEITKAENKKIVEESTRIINENSKNLERIKDLQKQLSSNPSNDDRIKALTQELNRTRSDLEKTKRNQDDAVATAVDKAKREVEQKVQEAEDALKKLQREYRTLENNLEVAQNQLTQAKQDATAVAEAKYKNDLRTAVAQAKQEATAAAEAKYKKDLRTAVDQAKQEATAAVEAKYKNEIAKINTLQQDVKNAQADAANARAKIDELTAQINELKERPKGGNSSGGHSTTGGIGDGEIVNPPEGISPKRQLEIKTRIERQCEAMDKEVDRNGASWRSFIIGTMAPTLRNFYNMAERRYAHDLYKAHLESQKNFSSMYIFTENCTKLIK